eukprot:110503-Amphidinium_carterae.3
MHAQQHVVPEHLRRAHKVPNLHVEQQKLDLRKAGRRALTSLRRTMLSTTADTHESDDSTSSSRSSNTTDDVV